MCIAVHGNRVIVILQSVSVNLTAGRQFATVPSVFITCRIQSGIEYTIYDGHSRMLKLGLKLFIITALSAGLLAVVFSFTNTRIQENKKIALQDSLSTLFESVSFTECVFTNNNTDYPGYWATYESNGNRHNVGVIIKTAPVGYAGPINMLVGIGTNGCIKDIAVLNQNETPGIGAELFSGKNRDKYIGKFSSKTYNDLVTAPVDTISGATITSKAIAAGVMEAYTVYNGIFRENVNSENK